MINRAIAVELKDVSFKYHSQSEPTLRDINLTIYRGEKVLILGASGSGKSTFACLLNGLIPFSFKGDLTGQVNVLGSDTINSSIASLSHSIGTVLQDTDSQFIALTVAEDIAFALENDCVDKLDMQPTVAEYAKLVGVEELLGKAPMDLSGGQKQRTTLAGVLIDNAELLLFDEPLANLDPATGNSTIKLIDEIWRRLGCTVIIIEHRLEDVLYKHVDRILVMDNGRLIADYTPNELLLDSVLKSVGIREPLYLTAMKYAGIPITMDMNPANIELLDLKSARQKLHNWYRQDEKRSVPNITETILALENINFSYPDTKNTLSNISFEIRLGEIAAIIGKNGAGKSTLSKLIIGAEMPDSGLIRYRGRDTAADSIKERSAYVGLVMQNPNQMISKQMIFDEVALGLRLRKVPETEVIENVREALTVCDLYPFRNWPVEALSYGQKKRLTIASILVLNPDIIILDEPTAGQDYKHYTEFMEFLSGLNRSRRLTIILITHDMHIVQEYCDHVLVLSEGNLIADTDASSVLTNDEIISKANLKKTSLYALAKKSDISDPIDFVRFFIDYDRKNRIQANEN